MKPASLSHCARLVHDFDHDAYLCILFAPAHLRESWFALFAFNHEIAAVARTVSEEMLGYIRFAWWREALDAMYAGTVAPQHPVIEALIPVIKAHNLPRAFFDAMLEAREADLEKRPLAEISDITAYCRAAYAPLFELCAAAAGLPPADTLAQLGILWGVTFMARAARKEDAAILTREMREAARQVKKDQSRYLRLFASFADTCFFYARRTHPAKRSLFLLPLILSVKHLFAR